MLKIVAAGILAQGAGKNQIISRAFFAGALARANEQIDMDPLLVLPHTDRSVALAGLGNLAEARTEAAKALELMNEGGLITGSRTIAGIAVEWAHLRSLLATGDRADRNQALARMKEMLSKPGMISPEWIQADPAFRSVVSSPEFSRMKRAFYERLSYPVLHHGANPHSLACPQT